jgi:hypothetical protein
MSARRYAALFLVATGLVLSGFVGAQSIPTQDPATVHETLDRYWNDSLAGGPPKDGIPSIDDPRFESAGQADRWINDEDRVIGVYRNGTARAYPQSILVWHEIVNDDIGDESIAITYCPLTGTALGFELGDDELGVSGRLINSNLIMYNRRSDTYWPQILAAGVQGPQKGRGLREVRVIWTDWAAWRSRHPETEVLSRRTGYARNYRRDPYGGYGPKTGYYAGGGTLFPVFERSDRFSEKYEIFGFRTAEEAVAIDPAVLAKAGIVRYEGTSADFLIIYDPDLTTGWVYQAPRGGLPDDTALGDLTFGASGPRSSALSDLAEVNAFEAMWIAWYAFYPDTAVIDGRN